MISKNSWGVLLIWVFSPMTQAQTTDALIYNRYCLGERDSTEIPKPNYENKHVKRAAEILSKVADISFYFYGGVRNAYGLKSEDDNSKINNANAFLVQLCGEYRDRPSLIQEKIGWVNRFVKLPIDLQGGIDPALPLWPQVSAHSYEKFLKASESVWLLKRAELIQSGKNKIQLGDGSMVDAPVEGMTICETKYVFVKYVLKSKEIPKKLTDYFKNYSEFSPQCAAGDLDFYYDYRGDSNLKHYSPEANGMIWFATSVAAHCESPTQAKKKSVLEGKMTHAQCVEYFRSPFNQRYNAARSGLATWIFRDIEYDAQFSAEGKQVVIYPVRKMGATPAFGFSFDLDEESNLIFGFLNRWAPYADDFWKRRDMGFEVAMGDEGIKYQRLRDAVNRHTDWYNSAWNDLRGMKRNQAYSPFVASSYEMSASDGFTVPGVTVKSESDGFKQWMFVFRVAKANWYNSQSLADRKPVSFDTQWFDETSLGTNNLAKTERAWDRLGTPVEGEFETALYLHNITQNNQVKGDGSPWVPYSEKYWKGLY